MENNPLVSVIVPVYNVEKYLIECVDSVINQTYKNLEIILVDDGSTDSSENICDEYRKIDKRIKVIHKENGGLSDARNVGLKNSNGEFVYFLDSDDYIQTDSLNLLVENINSYNSDFVFFDSVSFFDNSDNLPKQNYIRKAYYNCCRGIDMLTELYKNSEYHASVPLMFFRKSFLDEENLTFKNGIYHEDELFTFSVYCKAKKVSYLNKPLYNRRYRDNSITLSKKTLKHFHSMCIVFEEMIQISMNINLTDEDAINKCLVRCALNIFNVFEKLRISDKIKTKNRLNSEKNIIKTQMFFNDKALKFRCYGKIFWVIYKIYELFLKGNK